MKKVTVYAATSGSYSDYSVDAIFSTKARAQAYREAFPKRDWNEIEEYVIDQWSTEIERGLIHYNVVMYKDGEVRTVERSEYSCADGHKVYWSMQAYWRPTKPWANFWVWAKDEKHAVKIANERRVQDIASSTDDSSAEQESK